MRIMIAEDDPTSRAMLAGIFQKAGHEVLLTCDGAEAWEVLRKPGAPALAILDWMMPQLSGPDVIRRVRERPTDQPPYLMILTSRADKSDIIAGLEAGANDYLSKPFNVGELCARVEVGRHIVELQASLAAKIEELRQAALQIKTLRGIVPICASCKMIRDDKGYWNQVESYISAHTEGLFSHSLCPSCVRRLYPEFADEESPTEPKTEG